MSGPDRASFSALYTRYGAAVRARCRAICGNHADADEALQESFLRAWRAYERFDGEHPLAWLQVIARNTSLEIIRQRRPWSSDPWLWLDRPDPRPGDPLSKADAARLLSALSAEDAAVLRLRHAEGWRIHEIAEHMGTSERTVRRQLERIEHRSRALLHVEEVQP